MSDGLLDLVVEVVAILDELGIPYAIGGSVASSMFGEPRSTADADIAVVVRTEQHSALLDQLSAAGLYVPRETAREALRAAKSFNVVAPQRGLKVDLFVAGPGLLDRMQIDRSVAMSVPGIEGSLQFTAPEDQVLRKLTWFLDTGSTSERQWRDVVALLRTQRGHLDEGYLDATAAELGLVALLRDARADADG